MRYKNFTDFGKFFKVLTDREREILLYKYGYYNGEVQTSADTARHFNISRERIRQLEANAMRKLNTVISYEENI